MTDHKEKSRRSTSRDDKEQDRKHRERRRSKGSTPRSSKKGTTTAALSASATEGVASASHHSNPQQQQNHENNAAVVVVEGVGDTNLVSTIVETRSNRERMRKMSKLGMEDPVQLLRDRLIKEKIAQLKKEREAAAASGAASSSRQPCHSDHRPSRSTRARDLRSSTEHQPSSPIQRTSVTAEKLTRRDPSRDRLKQQGRAKSDHVSFQPPAMLNGISTPYMGADGKRKKKPRSRSLDNDMDILMNMELDIPEEGVPDKTNETFPPFSEDQLAVTLPNSDGLPRNFNGIIEATEEQKQLMRKVSALGMQDPVFRHVHDHIDHPKEDKLSKMHASLIFDDMDLNDVPEDMRDMISRVSDHTDPSPVDVHRGESPLHAGSTATKETAGSSSKCSSRGAQPQQHPHSPSVDQRKNYVPPVGSFVRRKSNRALMKDASGLSPMGGSHKGYSQQQQPQSDRSRSTKSTSESTNTNQNAFVPPSGSFKLRRPRKRPPRAGSTPEGVLQKDVELFARGESLYPDLTATSLSHSFRDLYASVSSFAHDVSNDLNDSVSSFHESWNSESKASGGTNYKPNTTNNSTTTPTNNNNKNHNSNLINSSSRHKPPRSSTKSNAVRRGSNDHNPLFPSRPMPPGAEDNKSISDDKSISVEELHRALPPSMDSIFPPKNPSSSNNNNNNDAPKNSKTKRSSAPEDRRGQLLKNQTPSSRSWDGDLNLDPIENPTDPLWSSMSHFDKVVTS